MDEIESGSSEGRLCGELAAAMTRELTRHDKSAGQGRKGSTFNHSSTYVFERAHEALEAVGVFARVPQQDTRALFAFTMDADQMPDFLANTLQDGDARVSQMLSAFVGIVGDVGGLSSERSPFLPPETVVRQVLLT
jgi:hypothetical protein